MPDLVSHGSEVHVPGGQTPALLTCASAQHGSKEVGVPSPQALLPLLWGHQVMASLAVKGSSWQRGSGIFFLSLVLFPFVETCPVLGAF